MGASRWEVGPLVESRPRAPLPGTRACVQVTLLSEKRLGPQLRHLVSQTSSVGLGLM